MVRNGSTLGIGPHQKPEGQWWDEDFYATAAGENWSPYVVEPPGGGISLANGIGPRPGGPPGRPRTRRHGDQGAIRDGGGFRPQAVVRDVLDKAAVTASDLCDIRPSPHRMNQRWVRTLIVAFEFDAVRIAGCVP